MIPLLLTPDAHEQAIELVADIAEETPLNSTQNALLARLKSGTGVIELTTAQAVFMRTIRVNVMADIAADELPEALVELLEAIAKV